MSKEKVNFLIKGNAIFLGIFIIYFIVNFGSGFELLEKGFELLEKGVSGGVWFAPLFAVVCFPIFLLQGIFPVVFIMGAFNMFCASLAMKIADLMGECTLKKVLLYIGLIINILMLLGLILYYGIWTYLFLIFGITIKTIITIVIFILLVIYLILIIKKCFFK